MVIADDGTFWMSISDFKRYFTALQICRYHDSYEFSSVRVQKKSYEDFYLIKMKITATGNYTLGLSQKDERCFPKCDDFKYDNCRFVIF